MLKHIRGVHLHTIIIALMVLTAAGCLSPKQKRSTATLLKTEEASQEFLMNEVDRFASVDSMRARVDFKFEDNSFAQFGSKEEYRMADAEIVVQRPANIFLKVQVPVIKMDVAQMTSDGEKFRVAVLNDGGSGRYKRFIRGSNEADYTRLSQQVTQTANDQNVTENVNAFSNLRPQHFTDAMLVSKIDRTNNIYTLSSIFQIEEDLTQDKKSPRRVVNRGYYLLDELQRKDDGSLKVVRRFWFDRVGLIRLARLQIFDEKDEIESDIVYGRLGNLTGTGQYNNLPLQVTLTRPFEKYSIQMTYQSPESVVIGRTYPLEAFRLENTWNLIEVDLDSGASSTADVLINSAADKTNSSIRK